MLIPVATRAARSTRRHNRRAGVLTLMLVVAGCAEARNGGGNDADALPRLEASEELRLGSVDDPEVGFSRIGAVDVDRDGQVYVYELLEDRLRIYDPAGQLIRKIGGPGEGPGEFRMLKGFGVVGDTVWTIDYGLRRITLFDRIGRVLSTGQFATVMVPLQSGRMSGVVTPRAMLPDGRFTANMSSFMSRRDMQPSDIGVSDTVQVPIVLFDASGVVTDTVAWDRYPPPEERDRRWVNAGPTRYSVPLPPTDAPLTVYPDDGRFVIDRARATSDALATFIVTRLTETGDTMFTREFTYRPERYGEAALDSVAWRSARIPGGAYNPVTGPAPTPEGVDIDAVRSRIREAMQFPEFQTSVTHGIAGDDGSLWLRREDDGGATHRWIILDGAGSPRGELVLPRNLRVLWVSEDRFWAVEPDEFDVPWLVRSIIGDERPSQ